MTLSQCLFCSFWHLRYPILFMMFNFDQLECILFTPLIIIYSYYLVLFPSVLFQGTATDLVVQIVLIAESMRLQAMMATYGIQTQTPHEVEPVLIWSSNQLVQVYKHLGINDKLGLSGRPARPIGALGTSKVMEARCTRYRLIFHRTILFCIRHAVHSFTLVQ